REGGSRRAGRGGALLGRGDQARQAHLVRDVSSRPRPRRAGKSRLGDGDLPPARPARAQALRCRLTAAGDGWHVEPTKAQGSHVLTSMLGAGALALIPAGDGAVERGERVEIELLSRGTLSG